MKKTLSMDQKQEFYQDMAGCKEPFTHIVDGADDCGLQKIDELYGAADVLSVQNAKKRRRILLALAFAGTMLTFLFLLYDEAELHGLILACIVMILCLFLINRIARRLDCHRKYLEYRVLAESLRVQYYLNSAGVDANVSELLPWTLKQNVPWILEILRELPVGGSDQVPALDGWVRSQRAYHEKALHKAEKKDLVSKRVSMAVLIITIFSYLGAVVFEIFLYPKIAGAINADVFRAALKILLGTLSAITLFTGSYYGKMSLSNEIDDHRRMIALYEQTEQEILQKGETEELLLSLARECLNENSTWYAYQSTNTPDISLG